MTLRRQDLSEQQVAEFRKTAIEWSEGISRDAAAWDLETVKHLALGNVAGLAGAAALVSSSMFGGARHPAMFFWFASGLILAVLNLYLGTWGYRLQVAEIQRRVRDMDANPTFPIEILFARRSVTAKVCGTSGMVAGWVSALCAIGGLVSIFLLVV